MYEVALEVPWVTPHLDNNITRRSGHDDMVHKDLLLALMEASCFTLWRIDTWQNGGVLEDTMSESATYIMIACGEGVIRISIHDYSLIFHRDGTGLGATMTWWITKVSLYPSMKALALEYTLEVWIALRYDVISTLEMLGFGVGDVYNAIAHEDVLHIWRINTTAWCVGFMLLTFA